MASLMLEITRKCATSCDFCSAMASPFATREMTLETATGMIESAARIGVDTIQVTGGEPFMHPDLLEIAGAAINHGMKVEILTSGIMPYSKPLPVWKLGPLCNAGCTISVGLHPYNANWLAVIINTMVEAMACGGKVVGRFVPVRGMEDLFFNIVGVCNAIGVKEIHVSRFLPHGRATLDMVPDPRFYERASRYRTPVKITFGTTCLGEGTCKAGTGKHFVSCDCMYSPCVALRYVDEYTARIDSLEDPVVKELAGKAAACDGPPCEVVWKE